MPNREPKVAETAQAHRCGGCGYDLSAIERAAQAEEAAGQGRGFCVVTCPECGKRWHSTAVWLFGEINARPAPVVAPSRRGRWRLSTAARAWLIAFAGCTVIFGEMATSPYREPGGLSLLFMFVLGWVLAIRLISKILTRVTAGPWTVLRFGFDREGVWILDQLWSQDPIAPRGDWLVELAPLDDQFAKLLIWERPVAGQPQTRLVMQATLQCPREMVEETQDRIVMALGLATPPGVN